MGRPICHILLVITALVQCYQCDPVQPIIQPNKASITYGEMFSHNWPLIDNQTVPIYNRNFNKHRQFGYVTYDPSSLDKCQMTLVETATSTPTSMTCNVDLHNPERKEIVWARLLLDDLETKTTNMHLTYSNEAAAENNHWHVVAKNFKYCDTKGAQLQAPGDTVEPTVPLVFPTPMPGGTLDPTVPLVDPTPTPGGTLDPTVPLVDPTPTPGGTLDPTVPLVDPTPGVADVDDVFVDLTSLRIWQPIILNSTNGYLVSFDYLDTDPTTTIVFVNSTSGETKVLGNVEQSSTGEARRYSIDHNKFGTCWVDGLDIVCKQDNFYGENVLNYTHIELPNGGDWYGVQNLKGAAMLIITGSCPEDKCESGTLYKIEGNNKVTMDVNLPGINMQCSNLGIDLTVDSYYDENNKGYCFNFVCIGSELQYRRFCIAEDAVEK